MRFAWDDDQLAFRDAARALLATSCPPSVVRAAWDAPPGSVDRGVWNALDAMGVQSVLVAEAKGGLGLDECFLVPVLIETGRVALPHPIVETAMVAAPLGVTGMVATDLGGPLVPGAADADALLLGADDGLRLFRREDVELQPVETLDRARRAARVHRRARGELVASDVESSFDRGALGTAAQLVGLAQAMLDRTVAYVVERRQFGVPIGSFQAVKHHLANALLRIEFALPAVARASVTLTARDVSMAKVLATDAAAISGRAALQCHGAIGYTVEHDLHLFLKRSWALSRSWGDRDIHVERVAEALEVGR